MSTVSSGNGSSDFRTPLTSPPTHPAARQRIPGRRLSPVTRPLMLPQLTVEQRSTHIIVGVFLMFSLLGGSIVRNTLGFVGYGIWISIALLIAIIWFVATLRSTSTISLKGIAKDLPRSLVLFLVWAVLSLSFSHWRLETAAGLLLLFAGVFIGVAISSLLSWREITKVLDYVTRIILLGSFLFELAAALFLQRSVEPAWAKSDIVNNLNPQNLWTESNLFEGGRIHGLVGNAADLSMIAAISMIVLSVRITDHEIRKLVGLPWIILGLGTLLLARSTTILVALPITAAVAAAVFIRRWMLDRDEVRLFWLGIGSMVATFFGTLLVIGNEILGFFGKSSTLTGRTRLWENLLGMIREEPIFGHGWLGYWPPWIEDLKRLTDGWPMHQIHAHNAWLDVWMQLGLVGLIIFGSLWFWALRRSWARAADVPFDSATKRAARSNTLSILPLLLLSLLFVQSFAESMILIEGTLVLFTLIVTKARSLNPEYGSLLRTPQI